MRFVRVRRMLNTFLNIFRREPRDFNELEKYLKETNVWRLSSQQYFDLWRIFSDEISETGPPVIQLLREDIKKAAVFPADIPFEEYFRSLVIRLDFESEVEQSDYLEGEKRHQIDGGASTVSLLYVQMLQKKFRPEQIVELAEADRLPELTVLKKSLSVAIQQKMFDEMKEDIMKRLSQIPRELFEEVTEEEQAERDETFRIIKERWVGKPIEEMPDDIVHFYYKLKPYFNGKRTIRAVVSHGLAFQTLIRKMTEDRLLGRGAFAEDMEHVTVYPRNGEYMRMVEVINTPWEPEDAPKVRTPTCFRRRYWFDTELLKTSE